MNENMGKFETLKLATKYWGGDQETSTLIIILFLLVFITLLIVGFLVQKYMKQKNLKHFFVKYAKNKGLTDEEIEILWTYANKMDRDPMLVLEFKAPFEKVVDLYIKSDPKANEELIQDMRKKLDFVIQSPYIPLITTKDIEIFQNGRMIFSNNRAINVALYDKDERYMYWLVVENDLPSGISKGETVKIVFIRNDDGIYTITLPIEDIINENGKTIVKLPHTFELHRTQRREYPRVKVNEPVKVFIEDEKNGETVTVAGRFEDISAGGGRICFDKIDDILKKVKYGEKLKVSFKLDGELFELEYKVLEKEAKPKYICFRGIFDNIDEKTKDEIMEFVQKEQLKMAQLKRKDG